MKFIPVLFFLVCSVVLSGQQVQPITCNGKTAYAAFLSEESARSLENKLEVRLKYIFVDTTVFLLPPTIEAPAELIVTPGPLDLTGKVYLPGDSVIVPLSIIYLEGYHPFFPQQIKITQKGTKVNASPSPIEMSEVSAVAMLYFTPYSSIEVWDIADFYNLKRRWLNEFDWHDPTVLTVNKSDIPVSDIPDDYGNHLDTVPWNSRERDLHEVRVPGLAYNVLMKAVPEDTVAKYAETDGYEEEPDSSDFPAGEVAFKKITLKRTFTGTVSGRLVAMITNDHGVRREIPLTGLEIKLKEDDGGGFLDETFGTTHTDNNGGFSFSYNEQQSLFEGKDIHLYLQVISRNEKYEIHASNFIGTNYKKTLWQTETGQSYSATGMRFELNNTNEFDPYTTTHWAHNAFRYFEQEGCGLGKSVRLNVFFSFLGNEGSYFLPSEVIRPVINLENADGDIENTFYHEFGHYAMYRLQGNEFRLPRGTDKLRHSWNRENTSRLAWIEGWANAVQMILDGHYWREDHEYGRDQSGNFYEYRNSNLSWPNNWNIGNGFKSEYYIACAIYDLWDGPNKNLPAVMPMGSEGTEWDVDANGVADHGFNDSQQTWDQSWRTIDDVELGLYELCQPLRQLKSGITTVLLYYNQLKRNISPDQCKKRSDIRRVFQENRITWNIPEYNWGWNNSTVTSDQVFQNESLSETGSFTGIGNISWTEVFNINFYNKNAFNEFHHPFYTADQAYNAPISDDYWIGIWDDFSSVYRVSHLYLNSGKYHSIPVANYYTCGNNQVLVRNGKLELGKTSTNAANLTVNAGSTLRIDAHGSLILHNNSTITIAEGATLIIEPGATITLNGTNSYIDIKGTLQLVNNAQLSFTGSGFIRFSSLSSNNVVYGNGAGFNLRGAGRTDKILEITQETLYVPDQNNFTAQNGSIELGTNCRLAVGGPIILNGVKVTSNTGTKNNHRGVYVFGNAQHTIRYSDFENGYTGLHGELMYNQGATLRVSNCNFRNNSIGLFHIAKGVNLTNCTFQNNVIGLQATAMDFTGQVNNCVFTGNARGIVSIGEATSGMNVYGSKFNGSAEYAVVSTGGHTTSIKCSDFIGNAIPISSGLTNRLNMSNTFNAGNNYFEGNRGIALFNSSAVPMLSLGRNDFSNSHLGLLFSGRISTTLRNISVTSNRWTKLAMNNYPANNVNYSLRNFFNSSITLSDQAPTMVKGGCLIWPEKAPCAFDVFMSPEGGIKFSGTCVAEELAVCESCDIIEIPGYPEVQLNVGVSLALDKLQNALSQEEIFAAVKMFQDILTATLSDPDPADIDVMKLAYDIMMKTVGVAVASETEPELSTGVRAAVEGSIQVLNSLEANLGVVTIVPPVNLAAAEAELYRLLDKREEALQALHDAAAWATYTVEEEIYSQLWICVLEHEINALDSTISWFDNYDLALCIAPINSLASNNAMYESPLASSDQEVSGTSFKVLPNPVMSELQISGAEAHAVKSEVILTDVNGTVLKTLRHDFAENAILKIDVRTLPQGVYFIRVNGSSSQCSRFVKL